MCAKRRFLSHWKPVSFHHSTDGSCDSVWRSSIAWVWWWRFCGATPVCWCGPQEIPWKMMAIMNRDTESIAFTPQSYEPVNIWWIRIYLVNICIVTKWLWDVTKKLWYHLVNWKIHSDMRWLSSFLDHFWPPKNWLFVPSEAVRLQDFAAGTCRRVSPQDFWKISGKDGEIPHQKWWFNGTCLYVYITCIYIYLYTHIIYM